MFNDVPTVNNLLGSKRAAVVTVGPNESMTTAARYLSEHGIGILVVTENQDRVVGVISERDFVRAVAQCDGLPVKDQAVHNHMATTVISCAEDDLLATVLAEMNARQIRHMPVLDDNGCLVGLVSLRDILAFLKDNTADLNEEIMWSHALSHL